MSLKDKIRVPTALRRGAGASANSHAEIELASKLPETIQAGRGSVLWLEGSYRSTGRVKDLRVTAGGRHESALAVGMPRPETISSGDWWWALLPIERSEDGEQLVIEIEAKARGRRPVRQQLGTVVVAPAAEQGRQTELALADPPLGSIMGFAELRPEIAICLPTKNPDPTRFAQQINSIRSQTYRNFSCVISDDGSDPDQIAAMERAIDGDERFQINASPAGLGAYRNAQRALATAPATAPYVVLAGQDDRWYPQRLEILLASFETDTLLVYSDALDVVAGRPVIGPSTAGENRNCASLRGLLVQSPVGEGAAIFRRELLTYALPFAPARSKASPAQWLSLVARALGGVRYVDTPLYDRLAFAPASTEERVRWSWRPNRDPDRPRPNWRKAYFDHVAWGLIAGEVLQVRCWELMQPRDRRQLERFLQMARGDRFLASSARILLRRHRSELAGARERDYLRGMSWRRVARSRGRFGRERVAS